MAFEEIKEAMGVEIKDEESSIPTDEVEDINEEEDDNLVMTNQPDRTQEEMLALLEDTHTFLTDISKA